MYKREDEKRLTAAVRELIEAGKTHGQIAAELNAKGEKTAEGCEWNKRNVGYFTVSRRKRILRAAGVKVPKRRTAIRTHIKQAQSRVVSNGHAGAVSRSVLESIITDPHLSAVQQVKMINAYLSA